MPNTFQTTRVGSKALGSVAHRSPFAEVCLILSLPSVCSVQKERTEHRRYVITWYVLRAPPAATASVFVDLGHSMYTTGRSLLTYIA